MKKIILSALAFIVLSCTNSDNSSDNNNQTIITTPFSEGTIQMGIFSNDIDLGKLIDKIDFSKSNVKQQYENLLQNDADAKAIIDVIQHTGNQNPLAAWAMTMNISESTYYIRNDEVLADVRGFGWNMNNYHNASLDKGSLFLETLTQIDQIAEEDRKIYTTYKPSESAGANNANTIDLSEFNRQSSNSKQNILGYECDIITYLPKNMDPNLPMQVQKIVVYTSPLFSSTINFTHPFYLEENGGILRLDVYYQDNIKPTLVMKPKHIKAHTITDQNLTNKTADPIYAYDDMNWAFKALAIMMSGWEVLD